MKIPTAPIHHVELDAESRVPPETVADWVERGWVEGRLERLAQADAAIAEAEAVKAAAAAAEWAREHPSDDDLAALAATLSDPDDVSTVSDQDTVLAPPPIAGRRGQSAPDDTVPTGTNPTTPEEG